MINICPQHKPKNVMRSHAELSEHPSYRVFMSVEKKTCMALHCIKYTHEKLWIPTLMSAMLDTAVETTEVNFSVSPVAKAFSIFSV